MFYKMKSEFVSNGNDIEKIENWRAFDSLRSHHLTSRNYTQNSVIINKSGKQAVGLFGLVLPVFSSSVLPMFYGFSGVA